MKKVCCILIIIISSVVVIGAVIGVLALTCVLPVCINRSPITEATPKPLTLADGESVGTVRSDYWTIEKLDNTANTRTIVYHYLGTDETDTISYKTDQNWDRAGAYKGFYLLEKTDVIGWIDPKTNVLTEIPNTDNFTLDDDRVSERGFFSRDSTNKKYFWYGLIDGKLEKTSYVLTYTDNTSLYRMSNDSLLMRERNTDDTEWTFTLYLANSDNSGFTL